MREGCFVLIMIGLLFVLLCVLCDCACLTLIAYFNGRFKKGRRRFLLSRHMLFVGDEVEGLGVVDVVFELFSIFWTCFGS